MSHFAENCFWACLDMCVHAHNQQDLTVAMQLYVIITNK
jgi:hypothetical protein